MNHAAHPPRNLPRLLAIGFALTGLFLASVSVSHSGERFEENANGHVLLKIHGGQFKSLTPFSVQTSQGEVIDVYCEQTICIHFHSEDFVYTITQSDLEVAVVVLPHSDATMQLILPRGISTLNIVQGCGKQTLSNAHVVHLNSVPRRGKIQRQ